MKQFNYQKYVQSQFANKVKLLKRKMNRNTGETKFLIKSRDSYAIMYNDRETGLANYGTGSKALQEALKNFRNR